MEIYTDAYVWAFTDGTQLLVDDTTPMMDRVTIHTGESQDTLWGLSFKFYGNHYMWHHIAKANNFIDPYISLLGVKIIIPDNGNN